MKKTDLSKFLDLDADDYKALGVAIGVDMARGPDTTVRVLASNPAHAAPYGACKGRHRVGRRERSDVRPKKIDGGVLATPHTCLDCGALMWRLHPGPKRHRRDRETED